MEFRKLNEEEIEVFSNLEISDSSFHDAIFDGLLKLDGGWVLKAVEIRFKAHKLLVDKRVMIAIVIINDGIIGKCAKHVDHIATCASTKSTIVA